MAVVNRGWFPPRVDPTKVGTLITAGSTALAAVVFAWQTKTQEAIIAAATSVISLATLLGLVRPNVTPVSDPRDTDMEPLVRADGSPPKGTQ